jgi:hypothetical protein
MLRHFMAGAEGLMRAPGQVSRRAVDRWRGRSAPAGGELAQRFVGLSPSGEARTAPGASKTSFPIATVVPIARRLV